MDKDLRSSIWNVFCVYEQENIDVGDGYSDGYIVPETAAILQRLWVNFFKKRLDKIPGNRHWWTVIGDYFFKAEWFDVYDFLEFWIQNGPSYSADYKDDFIRKCNYVLEKELSAYRIVGEQIVEITSEDEIEAIESALSLGSNLLGVRSHLHDALEKLSDRKNPDYRNSIKESISAVEAMACKITGTSKVTLGEAIKHLESHGVPLHGALKKAWVALYGWTSNEGGIRHSMMEESKIDFADAKYMLVSCSAFVNYLVELCGKNGVSLK